ncbi:MAG TPA: Zn-ribbon domain-containing OB-fold protein [Nitrososphaerales archaeon]|nr:Zn-ribbon domain-containing OB-fold protein [Nitrososphaerales archaeon]
MNSRVARYPGTEITADDSRAGRYLLTRYETELKYSWSSGQAISRFLSGLRDGELWGRRCDGCGRTMVPPRMYCELCFRPTDAWVRLRDTGMVVTYSLSYVNADASRRGREQPIVVAVIEIEDASPMMGLLHVLGEVSRDQLAVGMRVKAVWRPKGERQGAITDIMYFRPARERPQD